VVNSSVAVIHHISKKKASPWLFNLVFEYLLETFCFIYLYAHVSGGETTEKLAEQYEHRHDDSVITAYKAAKQTTGQLREKLAERT
jgi:hypothetical protein